MCVLESADLRVPRLSSSLLVRMSNLLYSKGVLKLCDFGADRREREGRKERERGGAGGSVCGYDSCVHEKGEGRWRLSL